MARSIITTNRKIALGFLRITTSMSTICFGKKEYALHVFWPRVSDGLECRLIRRSNSPDVETRADGIFRFFFARETLYMYVLV